MQKEHAMIVKEPLSIDQLEYLVKKANRLGLDSKQVVGVWEEEDHEGKHIFLGLIHGN